MTLCPATVAIGMVLRVVSGQGTAAAFVVVALVFPRRHHARLADSLASWSHRSVRT